MTAEVVIVAASAIERAPLTPPSIAILAQMNDIFPLIFLKKANIG